MGIFDFVEKIVEKTVETAISLPSVPIKAAKGLEKGTKKGIKEIEDSINRLLYDD
jgi:hypothetical protein